MSTTTDVSVAISYAVKKETRSALLFRFVTRNKLERGDDVIATATPSFRAPVAAALGPTLAHAAAAASLSRALDDMR